MPVSGTKPLITVDGNLADRVASEQIDYGAVTGFSLYATQQNGTYYFALSGNVAIGASTTFWLDTDRNPATGYQNFGFAGGAEYNVTIAADGTAAVYSGGPGQTLIMSNIPAAYSTYHQPIEFALPAAVGNPANFTINSSDTSQTVFKGVAPGALIRNYINVGWTAYQSISGTGQTIATETTGGQTYSAAIATTSGLLVIDIDSVAPARPAAPTLSAASNTGTAKAGSVVTLFDGTIAIGTAKATAGIWSIAASPLADGIHSTTVTELDTAGNVSHPVAPGRHRRLRRRHLFVQLYHRSGHHRRLHAQWCRPRNHQFRRKCRSEKLHDRH